MHGEQELLILKAEALSASTDGVPSVDGTPPTGGDPPGKVLGKDGNKGILIQTGSGVLAVRELQYRAKKAIEWRAFLNGAREFIGSRLG
jgi:methionyl-tRNA formyltransferase